MTKICPKCRTQYTDVSLRFCLQDGAALTSPTPTEEKTEQFSAEEFSAAETIATEGVADTLVEEVEETVEEFPSEETIVKREVLRKGKKQVPGFMTGLFVGLICVVGLGFIGAGIWFIPSLFQRDDPTPDFVEKRVRLGRSDIAKVTSSSTRKRDGKITYSPENAFDNDEVTAWAEGVPGPGKGEWIKVDFERTEKLVELSIKPGYFKNTSVWKKNNRVASIRILLSEGTDKLFEFPDSPKERRIPFPQIETDSVKITIRDIHPGSADQLDTLITEIGFTAVRMVEE